jgi:hypothetical protein
MDTGIQVLNEAIIEVGKTANIQPTNF